MTMEGMYRVGEVDGDSDQNTTTMTSECLASGWPVAKMRPRLSLLGPLRNERFRDEDGHLTTLDFKTYSATHAYTRI